MCDSCPGTLLRALWMSCDRAWRGKAGQDLLLRALRPARSHRTVRTGVRVFTHSLQRRDDMAQNRREASGREEAGEPSEDGAGREDPTCKEGKEPADRQAWNETAQARLTDRPLAGRRRSERW